MEDTDYFVRKEDFKDSALLVQLSNYAAQLLPDAQNAFKNLVDGQEVKKSELQKIMDSLQENVLEHLGKDGQPDNEDGAKLERLLFQFGIQL